jgi:hypothetical protein
MAHLMIPNSSDSLSSENIRRNFDTIILKELKDNNFKMVDKQEAVIAWKNWNIFDGDKFKKLHQISENSSQLDIYEFKYIHSFSMYSLATQVNYEHEIQKMKKKIIKRLMNIFQPKLTLIDSRGCSIQIAKSPKKDYVVDIHIKLCIFYNNESLVSKPSK